MIKIAVMASGRGSNFEAIVRAVRAEDFPAEVSVLVSDREDAQVLRRAEKLGIDSHLLDPDNYSTRKQFERKTADLLSAYSTELVALAGFTRQLSPIFIERFSERIMNIHPSLLPAFKGLNAQKQALDFGVKITGCTVHFVTEKLDNGPIILQAPVVVKENDDVKQLSRRIRRQEHKIYPQAIELFARDCLEIRDGKVLIKDHCRQNFDRRSIVCYS